MTTISMMERRLGTSSTTELAFVVFVPLAAFIVAFLCMLWFLFYASDPEDHQKDTRDPAEHGMQAKDSLAIEKARTDYSRTDYTTGTEYPDSSPDRPTRKKKGMMPSSLSISSSSTSSSVSRPCTRLHPCRSDSCPTCQKRNKRRTKPHRRMSNGSNASGNNNTSATNNNNNNNKDQPSTSTIRKIQEWWKKDFDETAFDTMSVDKPDGASYNAFYDPEIGEANHISEMYAPSIHSETSFPDDEVSLNQQQNDDVSTLAPDCGSTMGGESLYTSATKTDNSTVRSGSVYTASEPA